MPLPPVSGFTRDCSSECRSSLFTTEGFQTYISIYLYIYTYIFSSCYIVPPDELLACLFSFLTWQKCSFLSEGHRTSTHRVRFLTVMLKKNWKSNLNIGDLDTCEMTSYFIPVEPMLPIFYVDVRYLMY